SHTIAKLEKNFGVQLFIRNKNGVLLTGDGEKILSHIKDLQQCNERLNQEISLIHGLESGTVRIGAFNSVTVHWLPHIISTFREEHPKIDIQVFQGGYDDVLEWINTNSVDLAFVSETIITDKMEMLPLYKDQLVCVVPKNFKPKNPNYITIDDVKDLTFVMQRSGYDQETLKFLERYHLSIYSHFHIENDNSIIAMVEAGFGVCIMPELVPKCYVGNVDIYPLRPTEYRTIGLISSNPHHMSPAIQKMKEHIIKFAHENNLSSF
ncbi:MAG TPA: LysR substrate-binding domain-containing protein, partial [Clostridia bacterium]|nr:LysR substrate-binding domain-containing protein [Clostridia bacterium]